MNRREPSEKRRGAEVLIGSPVRPGQADGFFVQRIGPKQEIVEKRGDALNRAPDQPVGIGMATLKKIEERW
jgi:hypothetical protein